jgi:leucyl-tRNA synthetase
MQEPYDFHAVEEKWQKAWSDAKLFEPQVDADKPKFFLTVPYPYTSGPQHIGHGRTNTIGDVIARYKRMRGFNVLWPMAFHITGTPVLAITRQVKAGDKKTLDLYRSYIAMHEKDEKHVDEILVSFVEPEKVARYFANTFINDFKAMGFSIDWTRQFTTGDKDYNAFVRWQFNTYNNLGYLTKGSYPVLYCTEEENAAGEDDIRDGDEIGADVVTYTTIKYAFEDGFLVAATFRPETIFGVTNLWVNPEGDYVKAAVDGELWYISKQAAEKLKRQDRKVVIGRELKGRELVGKKVKSPIEDRELPVLAAAFVDTAEATGVVYSVPAHAPYDYIALRDSNLVESVGLISMITVPGFGEYPAKEVCERLGVKTQADKELLDKATDEIYKNEFYKGVLKSNTRQFSGKKISDVKEEVVKWLKQQNMSTDFYDVSALRKPVKCRCGGDIVVAVLKDQWFLNFNAPGWKQKATKCLEDMTIYPETYRKSFEGTFAWLDKRPCARRRGLGTELPFQKGWIIESLSDSTIYMAFYTVKRKINEYGIRSEQLMHEFWDYVFLGRGDVSAVSEKTKVPAEQLDAMRKEFLGWYPNDQRHTAVAHISNHLSFFIFAHAAIFEQRHWPRAITLNELVICEGTKMSKSKGNVIPLIEISQKYSADLYRLYVAYTADLGSVMDWREKDVADLRGKLARFYEFVSEIKPEPLGKELSNLDRWLLSRVNKKVSQATEALEGFRTREYAQAVFFDILNDLSHYRKMTVTPNAGVLWYVAERWLKLMAPITPHICEELWHAAGNESFISMADWPVSDEYRINQKMERSEQMVITLHGDMKHVLELAGIKPEKIYVFIAPDWKRAIYEKARAMRNPNELMKEVMADEDIKRRGKEAAAYAQWLVKHSSELASEIVTTQDELAAVEGAKGFLAKEFGAEVTVLQADLSENPKAKNAVPMKPAIFVE